MEPLTPEKELLWEKGILGSDTPKALATEQYLHPDWFALRSGDQHRRLRFKDSQIQVVETEGKRAKLVYIEDSSKNTRGGLKAARSR